MDRMKNNLSPRYTFETFMVDDTNRFAVKAAQTVAQKPISTDFSPFNPLFIYGESGVGKTHLLHAIRHYININHQSLRISFIDCESCSELSLKLKEACCDSDVLLFDNFQCITYGNFSGENLFLAFNTIYRSKKLMVFTSNRSPKAIPNLDERLIAMLAQGFVVDFSPPNFENKFTNTP